MQLTLFVPGLRLPRPVLDDTVFDLSTPALSRLLGQGARAQAPRDWLAAACGLPVPAPVAALRKVGAGDTASGEWLCLDPVEWRVAREGITLADPARLALRDEESAALIDALRPLFADWGELSASAARHWEVKLARPAHIETRPLPESIGQPVDPSLPAGRDGAAWRRLLAEAQVMLHAHPVNRQREVAGQPRVNSLWPWGTGSLPMQQVIRAPWTRVHGDDALLRGLCVLAGVPCAAQPARHAALADQAGDVLCVIDTLAGPARARDALAWRTALLALENDWIAPALASVANGHCTRLQIVAGGDGDTLLLALARPDLWRFWRRPLPLGALA